ncbi:hypothetical protein cyc_06354 [Cyclospora cayetanensis]|uniref:Uncharacterized protein n=1 Tax=Cyclospora cayetanensis TaxID=88456 RepID=A0A1D3DAP3_9EIME|nr:hypothetical protein cyc_06354 [Cyclospora cayetanensis]
MQHPFQHVRLSQNPPPPPLQQLLLPLLSLQGLAASSCVAVAASGGCSSTGQISALTSLTLLTSPSVETVRAPPKSRQATLLLRQRHSSNSSCSASLHRSNTLPDAAAADKSRRDTRKTAAAKGGQPDIKAAVSSWRRSIRSTSVGVLQQQPGSSVGSPAVVGPQEKRQQVLRYRAAAAEQERLGSYEKAAKSAATETAVALKAACCCSKGHASIHTAAANKGAAAAKKRHCDSVAAAASLRQDGHAGAAFGTEEEGRRKQGEGGAPPCAAEDLSRTRQTAAAVGVAGVPASLWLRLKHLIGVSFGGQQRRSGALRGTHETWSLGVAAA